MRIARALVLSAVVPLLGVAALGVGLGYRSASGLGQFVLLWAIFILPLVVAIGVGGYFACERLGFKALWHFTFGGFFAGAVLGFGWFGPLELAPRGSRVPAVVALSAIAGLVGAATGAVFWYLSVRERDSRG